MRVGTFLCEPSGKRINSQSIAVTALNETTYGFGEAVNGTYPYVLEYVEGNKQDTEHFVWTMNVPVSNFAPVQLTYTVKLTNPKRAAGTYGVFDATKPTVSYTSTEPMPPAPNTGTQVASNLHIPRLPMTRTMTLMCRRPATAPT